MKAGSSYIPAYSRWRSMLERCYGVAIVTLQKGWKKMFSIMEALQNAKCNLVDNGQHHFAREMGKQQLINAVTLLEKGYPLHDPIDPILEAYPEIDKAPDYED